MSNLFKIVALASALATFPAHAENYVVDVNGIVCQFCSLGVAKKVSKLPFVDRTKFDNGVLVEAEEQKVTFAVKSGAAMDRQALFAAIEDGGYDPIEVFELLPDGQRRAWSP